MRFNLINSCCAAKQVAFLTYFLAIFLLCILNSRVTFRVHDQEKPVTKVYKKSTYTVAITIQKVALPEDLANQYWESYPRLGYRRKDFQDSTPKIRNIPTNLKIDHNGKMIYVPYSCYSDLADINDIQIKINRSNCILLIDGGDGALSYDAKIIIENNIIIKRQVHAGEMEDASEETKYL